MRRLAFCRMVHFVFKNKIKIMSMIAAMIYLSRFHEIDEYAIGKSLTKQ